VDNDTGLNYMQARYYDPLLARFYSNDPVGYTANNPVMSFNRYLYVNNNPYKYKDPDGNLAVPFAIGGCAVSGPACPVGAGVGAVIGKVATILGLGYVLNEVVNAEATDNSNKKGTKEEVDDFVKELDAISEPQSDNTKVRTLEPGVSVDDLLESAPGTTGENGRNKTEEGGNIGGHGSSSTKNSDGSGAKTLSISRPKGSGNRKYRESDK
jgi:RHS repeat-associated protein